MSEPRTKYGNRKTTIDGITFDSKKEAQYYGQLKLMQRSGLVTSFTLQPVFRYQATYTRDNYLFDLKQTRKYIADFSVTFADGHTEIWDVKGVRTTEFIRKKKIIETLYNIKIIEK